MKAPSERTIYNQNLQVLGRLPPFTDRDVLTQLCNTKDFSSLPRLDNPTYNALIRSLTADSPPTRRSAHFYIASNLIKNESNQFVSALRAFLWSPQPPLFLKVVEAIDLVDDEEDFTLCCQMIAAFPISHLNMTGLDLSQLTDPVKKRLLQLLSSFCDPFCLYMSKNFQKYANEDWETFSQIISSFPKLSELHLDNSNLDELSVERWSNLGDIFASLPDLSTLSLKNIFKNPLDKAQWTAFSLALSRATHLVSLNVSKIDLVVNDDFNSWEIFCNTVSLLPQLESLNLSDCVQDLDKANWQHLRKFSRLSTLKLKRNFLGANFEKWEALCNALRSLSQLSSLDLSVNNLWNVSDEGWEVFAPLLKSLKHLSLADMGDNDQDLPDQIADKDWRLLFQSIQTSNLFSLDLAKSPYFFMRMDDACFDLFCQAVVDAKHLSKLHLWGEVFEGISQERFQKFCNTILAATHLSDLDLSNTFQPELMPILFETLKKAKHLTSIALRNSFDLDAAGWRLFWNEFSKTTHITTLGLSCPLKTLDILEAFSEGLTQATHLSSFVLSHIVVESKTIWNALKPLFNLVKFEAFIPLPPDINDLLIRNNELSQFRASLREITTQLNSASDELTLDEVKQRFIKIKAYSDLLQTLPDHPNSEICREEFASLLNDFYFAGARWCARNNDPMSAINGYMLIPIESTHFTKARENAFTIAYQAYRTDNDTATQAFPKALPLCLENNRLILLDAEFQRIFDAFLLEAVGLTKTLELIPKVTAEVRLKMFKYLSLLVLKEELQLIKSTDQTDFFQKKSSTARTC